MLKKVANRVGIFLFSATGKTIYKTRRIYENIYSNQRRSEKYKILLCAS